MRSVILRTLICAAGLAALGAATAGAHHEAVESRHFLAFWGGFRPTSQPQPTPEACRDGQFWAKGFVSIYSQGAE